MTSHALLPKVGALAAIVALSACARGDSPRSLGGSPTAPSALSSSAFVDPAAARVGTMAAALPSPEDALAFRQVLEAFFQARGVAPTVTFVNAEGVIVWTLEYVRYRSSGCSQAEAIDKVFTQIDRRGVPAPCGSPTESLPPLDESQAFRQQLEVKYRELGAPPTQTYVNPNNEVLYTIEFVRYTQSGCSSATSYERVLGQIDNRGVAPDCRPTLPAACSFGIAPVSQNAPAAGGTFTASIAAEPADCSWRASADVPWITGTITAGTGPATLNFTAAANPSSTPRTGRITLTGGDGTQLVQQVTQPGQTTPPPPGPPPPPACTYALSRSVVNAIPEGGNYDVDVVAPTGCSWNAASSAAFAPITSGGSGSGNGTIRFTFARNTAGSRQGSATLFYPGGSQTIVLSQQGSELQAVINAPASCETDTNCNFDGTGSRGVITSYEWNFGDGDTGNGATVTHVYPFSYVSDDYPDYSIPTTVTLTVRGPAGSSTTTVVVTVFYPGGFGLFARPARKPGP
jgi:hypothetical protein